MKNLYLVIFATLLLALLIIYHDRRRSAIAPKTTGTDDRNIYLVVCEGVPVRLKPAFKNKSLKNRSQFQDVSSEDMIPGKIH
ncbi:MAG: hypothetical protein PHV59_08910 [Victivallales bacterium]|nr:hypothetical protein [Victivallales bacterium]